MALSIDGSASAIFSTTNTKAVVLTTTVANDIIVLYVGYEINAGSGAPTVSTVTDTASLTWTRRGGAHAPTNGKDSVVDVWWAHSPGILTNDSITVTLSGNIDDGALIAWGVSGVPAANYSAPWDTNVALPVTGVVTSNAATGIITITGISTTAASGMLLPLLGSEPGGFAASPQAGFTYIVNGTNSGGINFWHYCSLFQVFSSAFSSASITPTASGTIQPILCYVDALSAVAITAAVYPPFDVESVDHIRRPIEVISY